MQIIMDDFDDDDDDDDHKTVDDGVKDHDGVYR